MILRIILIYKLLQTNKTFFRGLKLSKLAKYTSFDNLGLILMDDKVDKPEGIYQQTIVL